MPFNYTSTGRRNTRQPGGELYGDSALYQTFEDQYNFAREDVLSLSELRSQNRSGFSMSDFLGISSQGRGAPGQARALYAAQLQRSDQAANEAFIGGQLQQRSMQLDATGRLVDTYAQDALARRTIEFQQRENSKDRRAAFWNSVVGGVLGGAATILG